MNNLSADQIFANLPLAVRAAIEQHDAAAFQCALDELPAEQAQQVVQQLEQAGIIGVGMVSDSEFQEMLQEFDLLIRAIVDVARGDDLDVFIRSQRSQVMEVLPRLDDAGYHLGEAVTRLWSGERRAAILTAGLDPSSTRLVKYILGLISAEKPPFADVESLISAIPEEVFAAIRDQDEAAFQQAMERLLPADRQFVAAQLADLQIQADTEAEAWLANLPIEVRTAVLERDEQRLQTALSDLPPAEAQEILEQLEAAGLLDEADEPEADLLMNEFEPLVLAVASVARGNEAVRPQLEALLADLDQQGWRLSAAVQHIWAGERDIKVLGEGLDRQDRQIIRSILEQLE